jgi:PAS domain S-box-containing protein
MRQHDTARANANKNLPYDNLMTLATRKRFAGKTQAVAFAEEQSEKWISWIRLIIASCFALASLFTFALGDIAIVPFFIQIGLAATIWTYSLIFILPQRNRSIHISSTFSLAFLDVTVTTGVVWSYIYAGFSPIVIHSALFCAYFIPITFTALHHQVRLSIFAGVLSAAEYILLCYWSLPMLHLSANDILYIEGGSIFFLLTVSLLSGLISRNNFRSIQKFLNSENRYNDLVHRLPQMLFTLDDGGYFIWSNMASYQILGIPAKALRNRNIVEFIPSSENFKLEKSGTRGTFEITDLAGNTKFVDCIVQPSEDSETKTAWEGSMVDVTDRELALSQREEMASRLFQYQKMESLGTLASGMAHDFNNILQTLSDIADRAAKETSERHTTQNMSLITETLVDAKFLISELLALGRKQPLDMVAIETSIFLKEIVSHFQNQIGPTYTVKLDVPAGPVWIQGDTNYLKRIFQNLFGNSRDAMAAGSGTITISCFVERNEGEVGNVVIRFIDTGSGIPAELKEKVFDPFFTTKKPGKGTGLGLALARRIATLHNGHIRVEKSDTGGTTFRLEIPESDTRSNIIDTQSILLNRLATTIILLDDDPKIREILKFFLTDLKYTVFEASNRTDALALLQKHVAECTSLVMDWKLAGDNPRDVITSMRAIKPELVVIVVSGYPADLKSTKELGIVRWFTKPYDKNRLDFEIQKSLYATYQHQQSNSHA